MVSKNIVCYVENSPFKLTVVFSIFRSAVITLDEFTQSGYRTCNVLL